MSARFQEFEEAFDRQIDELSRIEAEEGSAASAEKAQEVLESAILELTETIGAKATANFIRSCIDHLGSVH